MNPDLAHGGSELRVSIAGVTILIASPDSSLPLAVEGPTARFVAPTALPDIHVAVSWGEPDPEPSGPLIFDSGGTWQLHRSNDRLIFRLTSSKFGSLPYKVASFAPDFSHGEVVLNRHYLPPGPQYPLEYPLDELLVTNWLSFGRGVELHACAVVDGDGHGYVFAGHSGDGKTTMARQWLSDPDVKILSDDRVVVRPHQGRLWIYGTPWHGDEPLALPLAAPLTHLFFVSHGARNEAHPIGATAAAAKLMVRCFPPFHSPRGLEATLAMLGDVAMAVPCLDLSYVPDRAIVDFVRKTARGVS